MSQPPERSDRMRTRLVGKRHLGWVAPSLILLGGVALAGAANLAIVYTNDMAFCTSCHTMQTNFAEYRETMHFRNPSGVQATCADCHVPKEFVPRLVTKIVAVKDVYHELAGTVATPEKFEARRWSMASRVWAKMKASDSRECRTCHDFANMDLSAQDRTARSRHAKAQDKGQTCIDCHKGVAHREPDPPEDTQAATRGGGSTERPPGVGERG